MKNLIQRGAPALLAALTLSLPLSADLLKGAATAGGGAPVSGSGSNASANGQLRGDSEARVGKTSVETGANAHGKAVSEVAISTPQPNRTEGQLRSEYRGFSRRLNKVDRRLDKAERDGRTTAEEARKHREAIATIRARFLDKADKAAAGLSKADKAQMDAEVKAEERAVLKAE